MGRVNMVSLGCPKNFVDSEKLLSRLKEYGMSYSRHADGSDVVLINTCGFIDDAKRESIEEIIKIAEIKKKSPDVKIVVFGCLAKRFGEEIRKEIPEVDAIWGVGDETKIIDYCRSVISHSEVKVQSDVFSDEAYAYLKISEGCDRGCTYCVIPEIRGEYHSRDTEEVLSDAEALIKAGKKELILVAQDITSYGKEWGHNLSRLIRALAEIEGNFWIRLLYLYPAAIDDRLLETIASEDKVVKYIDMPLQHSEERILRLMGRGGSRRFYERLISHIREVIPDVALRTSIIVGFPGETEEDFSGLSAFVEKMKFDRLGVFQYSKEEGTAAYSMKGHVPKKIKESRFRDLMGSQAAISLEKNRSIVGKQYKALVDESDSKGAVGRIYSQAPEIDGVVFLDTRDVQKGDFIEVEIIDAYDYDLKGRVLE